MEKVILLVGKLKSECCLVLRVVKVTISIMRVCEEMHIDTGSLFVVSQVFNLCI